MAQLKVGSIVTATLYASVSDYDKSAYQSKPMQHGDGPITDRLMIISVRKNHMVVRENDGIDHELKYVGKGYWQMVGGESVAYKFPR